MTAHAPIGTRRKVGLHHLAFLRGQIQDPDLKKWWDQYLYIDGDFRPRLAKQTLQWLSDELSAAAHRAQLPRFAGILRRDSARMPDASVPPLEDFAVQFPPGFYTDRELAEKWQAEYGHTAASRRRRLIERQLAALRELEPRVATHPMLTDEVAGWLDDKIAPRLAAAGIRTLADLIARINGKGLRWWSGIPGIGRHGGARILRWVKENAPLLGAELGAHVDTPITRLDSRALQVRRGVATAVAPFESFLVPEQFNGASGVFRRRDVPCLISANNDYAAIVTWLAAQRSPHTSRAYRKEAERVLLWAILARQTPLSSLDFEDCLAFQQFLRDPQPRQRWCGPRGRRRFGGLWKPFEGPLSPTAEHHALTVLGALWDFLLTKNYLLGNPWVGIKSKENHTPRIKPARSFSEKQWAFIQFMLTQLPERGSSRRLNFAVNFAYATGMRLSELVNARVRDLEQLEFSGGEAGWIIRVIGKRYKEREVPVPDSVMALLADYLNARGLDGDPLKAHTDTYLIGRIDDAQHVMGKGQPPFNPEHGIAGSTFYDELKRFFTLCAQEMRREDVISAEKLLLASTHWLRHTHATHALNNEDHPVPLHMVQENLGHQSPATTSIYIDTEIKARHRAMRRFLEGAKKRTRG